VGKGKKFAAFALLREGSSRASIPEGQCRRKTIASSDESIRQFYSPSSEYQRKSSSSGNALRENVRSSNCGEMQITRHGSKTRSLQLYPSCKSAADKFHLAVAAGKSGDGKRRTRGASFFSGPASSGTVGKQMEETRRVGEKAEWE